jgi:hypothetical protein
MKTTDTLKGMKLFKFNLNEPNRHYYVIAENYGDAEMKAKKWVDDETKVIYFTAGDRLSIHQMELLTNIIIN